MSAPMFRRGGNEAEKASGKNLSMADFGMLTDIEKQHLCQDLLEEFGATVVKIKPDGEMIHSCCLPFGHRDSSPSAALNYQTLQYNCFRCGGGSLMWFIGVCRGGDTAAVRKWLTQATGINRERPLEDLLRYFDALWNPVERRPPPIPRMNPVILDNWMLLHPYLTEIRHIPEANVEHFKVGWDPAANRIVIPHFWKGNLVGWQTRRLINDGSPKYDNSPDFPKDRTLYNYQPSARRLIVVEGCLSIVSKFHLMPEHTAMVGTFGAEIGAEQIKHLGRHDRVTLWLDNDEAGWQATERLGKQLSSYCPVGVIDSDLAADPADLDDATCLQMLDREVPYSLWRRPTILHEWSYPCASTEPTPSSA